MRVFSAFPVVLLSFCAGAVTLLAQGKASPAPARPSFAQPSLSPDAKEIAFVSGGDIWTVPASGGEAHLLISDPAEESRPLYSPDGTRLAFQSTRTGGGDIYVLTFASGQLQRITYSDAGSNLDAWSHDGQWLYFTASTNDVAGQGDIFRVRSSGGTPLEVSRERYLNEFEAAPSPDGKQIALVAKGISSGQWWRNGHAHIDETELWLKPVHSPSASDAGYHLLVPAEAKHAWPMWSADGRTLLYMSDGSATRQPGSENLWSADAGSGTQTQLTHFTSGRLLWPSIAYDGSSVVFERNFGIWRFDTRSGEAKPVAITLRGVPSSPGLTRMPITAWSDLALSPDGKKIAVAGHGEIFAGSAKDGGEPQRLTRTDARESEPVWSADSTHVLYQSERDGGSSLYEFDENTGTERSLTHGHDLDLNAVYSPDGKSVAFLRNRHEVHVLTLDGLRDRVVATGEINAYGSNLAWSPDNKWVVFLPVGTNGFSNLYVVPADGSAAARPITFLANGQNASHLAWSPDGKYILFDTAQRAEQPQLARVDLVPHVPGFREDQFRDLFRKQSTPGAPDTPGTPAPQTRTSPAEPAPASPDTPAEPAKESTPATDSAPAEPARGGAAKGAAKKPVPPVRIVFEGIRERLTLLPIGLGVGFPVISPDGKTLAFLAEVAGQSNIYTYSLDELAREPAAARQLTSTPGGKTDLAFTPDSKEIFYIERAGGRGGPGADAGSGVRSVALESRTPKPVALTAAVDVDFDQEKMVVFDEAWTTLDRRFFRGDFNGQNWASLREEWRPYIAGARTGPELRRNINLLIGELNSSHSGINKAAMPAVRTGRLGLRFEREPFETSGALVVREVVPLGPAAIEGSLRPGIICWRSMVNRSRRQPIWIRCWRTRPTGAWCSRWRRVATPARNMTPWSGR